MKTNPICTIFAFFYALFFAAVTMVSCSNNSTDKPQLVEAKDSITVDSTSVAFSDSVMSKDSIDYDGLAFINESVVINGLKVKGNNIIIPKEDIAKVNELIRRNNKEDIAIVIFGNGEGKMLPRLAE